MRKTPLAILEEQKTALIEIGMEAINSGCEYGEIIQKMNFYGSANRIHYLTFERAVNKVHDEYYKKRDA